MIIVSGSAQVQPGKLTEATAIAAKMVLATRAEDGCICYSFAADVVNPLTFLIYEEWESEEHLTRHFQTAHMAEFQAGLPAVMEGGAQVKLYEISSVRDL